MIYQYLVIIIIIGNIEIVLYITFLLLNLVVCRHCFTKHELRNSIIVRANHCNVLVCTYAMANTLSLPPPPSHSTLII